MAVDVSIHLYASSSSMKPPETLGWNESLPPGSPAPHSFSSCVFSLAEARPPSESSRCLQGPAWGLTCGR
jgi:hypothetical protein